MKIQSTVARALRKLADLIDPRVSPSDAITIRINVDSRDAVEGVERLERAVERAIGKLRIAERDLL